MPYVHVGFYNDQVYLREMKFYTWAEFMDFQPSEWNRRLGDMIELPEKLYKARLIFKKL